MNFNITLDLLSINTQQSVLGSYTDVASLPTDGSNDFAVVTPTYGFVSGGPYNPSVIEATSAVFIYAPSVAQVGEVYIADSSSEYDGSTALPSGWMALSEVGWFNDTP